MTDYPAGEEHIRPTHQKCIDPKCYGLGTLDIRADVVACDGCGVYLRTDLWNRVSANRTAAEGLAAATKTIVDAHRVIVETGENIPETMTLAEKIETLVSILDLKSGAPPPATVYRAIGPTGASIGPLFANREDCEKNRDTHYTGCKVKATEVRGVGVGGRVMNPDAVNEALADKVERLEAQHERTMEMAEKHAAERNALEKRIADLTAQLENAIASNNQLQAQVTLDGKALRRDDWRDNRTSIAMAAELRVYERALRWAFMALAGDGPGDPDETPF